MGLVCSARCYAYEAARECIIVEMTMALSIPEPTERLQNSSWRDKARTVGGCLLYFAFTLGGLVVVVLALQGMGWIAKNIHPWTALAAEIAGLGIVPLSLLLAIFRKTRAISTVGLLISSYVIGLGLWIWSLIIAYNFAGVAWLIIGLVFVGIGVVPVALVAAAISGGWSIARREEDSAIELLKMLYASLARFLPEPQALLVTQRNLAWLSGDPKHPGLRGAKEAEAVEAEVNADEEQLSQDFDRVILALLEKARAQSDKTRLEKQLLDLFHELAPDDPQFVEDLLLEAETEEGTPERWVRDAVLSWRQGDRETALALFTSALEMDPDNGTTLLNRGNLQLEMGYFEDGIRELERARDIDPELPWQNALLFKALDSHAREMTRQATLKNSERSEP